ncbi:helix-turn-helix domain-containing protein [Kitasatospora sp. NPDC001660]
MALRTQISERQRRFGAELRRLRETAGLAVKDAGALIGIVGPQLSHIEAARTSLDPERLAILLDGYGCTDKTYATLLHDLGTSDGKGWWTKFKGKVPDLSLDLAELEDRSVYLDNYETLYIPGLLQLPAYAEAIYKDSYRNGLWDLATAVQFRTDRQRILDEGQRKFRFVIHEAALRMLFPGESVMRAQLIHLLDMAERPNVDIQILPFAATRKPSQAGGFVLCNPGCTDLSTIVLDLPGSAKHDGSPESIAAYNWKFQQLSEIALPAIDAATSYRQDSQNSWGLLQYLLYPLRA